jgi:hypothetical protein
MKGLYELIPSRRARKRFINIYRLLRASVLAAQASETRSSIRQCQTTPQELML